MSYASAHAELKRLERASMVRSRVEGNSLVFEANKNDRLASAFEALLQASASRPSHEDRDQVDRIVATLASLGAPVRTEVAPVVDLPAEEVIARGLQLTHRDPALARAYPILLARNRNSLDLENLKRRATELHEKRTLGFFLDLTGMLANDSRLRRFAWKLKDHREKTVRDFFAGPHGKYARQLADQRTPQLARDWLFRMDMDLDNFRDLYSKFCEDSCKSSARTN